MVKENSMLKKYWVWISLLSFISLTILAVIKLQKDFPDDLNFIITEWILLILFIVPPLIFIFKGE